MEKHIINRRDTNDIRYVKSSEPEFPVRMKQLSDCPEGIYIRGVLPDPERKSVAIVGARMCTEYGRSVASYFAQKLSEQGVQIISGLALGIDGAAHEGALKGGGKTFAVLAGGADICYPRSHIGLYEEIRETGGIISESPCGYPSLAGLFPKRNRIISVLADLVLVVEARKKSGSLITADFACEQGKDLFAVPGRLDDELSAGCNDLISQGAGIALDPDMLLEILGKPVSNKGTQGEKKEIFLATEENLVYSCLRLQPKSLDALCAESGLSMQMVIEAVMKLQLRGIVKETGKNQYVKIH